MKAKLSFFEDATVNLVTEDDNGVSTVTAVPASKLPALINQNFVWTNDILIDEDHTTPCCVINMSEKSAHNARELLQQLYDAAKLEPLTIVLIDKVFYYLTALRKCIILNHFEDNEINKPILAKLKGFFEALQCDTPLRPDKNITELLQSLFGKMLNFRYLSDTISSSEFAQKMKQVQDTHKKLAIKRFNDTVENGVIALEDIPAGTAVTFYAGKLSNNAEDSDDVYEFAVGVNDTISGSQYRNFSGFLTHAFPRAAVGHRNNSVITVLEEFESVDKNDRNWHSNIVAANVEAQGEVIHDHIPYVFFVNPKPITAGSIIAFNYGSSYWQYMRICPALLTLNGAVIDPKTYTLPKAFHFPQPALSGTSPSVDNPNRFLATKKIVEPELRNEPDLSCF